MNNQASQNNRIKLNNITSKFDRMDSSRPFNYLLPETDDYFVTPCVGSIVSNWIIVWPRSCFLNCREWKGSTNVLSSFSSDVLKALLGVPDTDYVWFEHGCEVAGNTTGCGVNSAHLHILIEPQFQFDSFRLAVERESNSRWSKSGLPELYPSSVSASDYHIFGNRITTYMTEHSTHLGSQFFRRVVASLTGNADKWDYREHTFSSNAELTVVNLATHSNGKASGQA